MKTIVFFYSRKGSNKFLAHRIANDLSCEIEEIFPRINYLVLMLLGLNIGNRKLKSKVEAYDNIILCGPIWMGSFIVPLKNFVNRNIRKINKLVFVTCCGSTFQGKDEKFGHNLVFNVVKKLSGEKCKHCEAFPLDLVLSDEQKKDPDYSMKYTLNSENFKGDIIGIYNSLLIKIREL